jgi:pimeloyl-ACP methyl ester carboxylesterase
MNLQFPKKSLIYLASLSSMVNVRQAVPRKYPLLIGCGRYDIPMEQLSVEMWKKNEPECCLIIFDEAGHCVNMDVSAQFNAVMAEFWTNGIT